MNVRTHRQTKGAFVNITSGSTDLTVLLADNMPASVSLRRDAHTLRDKAARLLARADLMEQAAEVLQ